MEKLITRTVNIYEVNALGIDLNNNTTFRNFTLPCKMSDKLALKHINEKIDCLGVKYVAIIAGKEIEKMYGMPISVFMHYAMELQERKQYI